MTKRSFACAAFFLLSAALAFCATVSVVVVERGIPDGYPKIEASAAWQDGFMGAFFDAGHIVSNSDIARRSSDLDFDLSYGWESAREGSADYLVLLVLDYVNPDPKIKAGAPRLAPAAAWYRITKIDAKGSWEDRMVNLKPSQTGNDDEANAQKAAASVISHLKDW